MSSASAERLRAMARDVSNISATFRAKKNLKKVLLFLSEYDRIAERAKSGVATV
jgi:hypothetical protein